MKFSRIGNSKRLVQRHSRAFHDATLLTPCSERPCTFRRKLPGRSTREKYKTRDKDKADFAQLAIFLRLIDSFKCTHPFLFALQQVESAGSLDARKEPNRMRAYKPLDQSDVARDLAARIFRRARRSTRGGRPFRGKRLLALKHKINRLTFPSTPTRFKTESELSQTAHYQCHLTIHQVGLSFLSFYEVWKTNKSTDTPPHSSLLDKMAYEFPPTAVVES